MSNQKDHPPKLPLRIFRWFCHPDYVEDIEGDLLERFEKLNGKKSSAMAKWNFTWQVLSLFRPGIIRSFSGTHRLNQYDLFRNYMKIAYRNMMRYKLYSFINVLGLTIGLAVSLLILIHIRSELSYESGYQHHERIFRVASTKWAKLTPVLAEHLEKEMPEIEKIGRLYFLYSKVMKFGKEEVLMEKPYYADPSILDIFTLNFLEGDVKHALDDPSDIVLTRSVADRVFKPGQQRIGAEFTLMGSKKYYVSAIVEDLPKNSHLKIDCMMPIAGTWVETAYARGWSGVSTYALLHTKEDAQKIETRLLDFQSRFLDEAKEDIVAEGDLYELNPIGEIHLTSHREKEIEANSDVSYLFIFGSLGVFILLVVVINFINLYVSQTLNRLKEVGVRKVVGAGRGQLIVQFLTEAFFLTAVSAALAFILVIMAIPYYNNFANVKISALELVSPVVLMMALGLVLIAGFLAGGYPAIYLSKFGIRQGLKTGEQKVRHKQYLRSGMVAFQFIIAVFLLTSTVIVSQQMDYLHNKNLGFEHEGVVAFKLHGSLWYNVTFNPDVIRSDLRTKSGVQSVSLCSDIIGDRLGLEPFVLETDLENTIAARFIRADPQFVETMGIELEKGEISRNLVGTQFILNEAAASQLQQQQSLLGQFARNNFQRVRGNISAVVKDFNFASLHSQVEPMIIEIPEDIKAASGYFLVKINAGDMKETIGGITEYLESLAPGTPIVYHFLDDRLENLYTAENDMFAIFELFSSVVIGLACLGLFALFAFVTRARTKELGIRKTLGASISQLLLLLSKKYVWILLGSIVLVIPLTRFFSQEWLSNFAYSIDVRWWQFVLPGFFVLLMAMVAIVAQSLRAVIQNPIDSLRDE